MYRLAWTLRAFCSRCRSKTHGLGKNRGFRPQLEVRCEEIRRGSVLVAGRICFLSFMGSMGSQRRDSTQRFGYRHRSAEPHARLPQCSGFPMEIPRGVQRCGSAVDVCFAHCFLQQGDFGIARSGARVVLQESSSPLRCLRCMNSATFFRQAWQRE